MAAGLFTRPQPVTLPMVVLFAIIPVYLVIGSFVSDRTLHAPELALDRAIPLEASWSMVYVSLFLAYPTRAPRHAEVDGDDFSAVALRTIYDSDVPYNCFPSLHVAQCFLAAFACYRVHRGVGIVTGLWACLVGMATLYTKQHYILDVLAGAFLACMAYLVFLRGYPREATPEPERRLAPVLALGAFGLYGLMVAGLWLLYALSRA